MELKIQKCAVLSFSRSQDVIRFDYSLDDSALKHVTSIRDLRVVVNTHFNPHDHVSHICNKAIAMLGFVLRASKNFRSANTLDFLYRTVIRPILEYASIVWSPYYKTHIEAIKRIKTRGLRIHGLHLGVQYMDAPVAELRRSLDLAPLQERKRTDDLIFLYKIVNGDTDCSKLTKLLDYSVPRGPRLRDIFGRRIQNKRYSYMSSIPRVSREGNLRDNSIDILGSFCDAFKPKVQNSL
ncbi:uncharacterized protein LOC124358242 [Homalodisca vitripennis]|uniref:uncharacterized protein LOC124358242 n=1 Tax=Homalodisca vitripennis TaxID=197043 RepID=UPI001EECCD83|nr:uncharacterized protein LOC124358242 [Homalodisca vitripennis]